MRNRSARAASCTTPLRAASPTADPRRLRRSLLCALALCALAAAPATAGADPTATLDVVPDGNGTVTISPAPAAAAATCVGSPDKLVHCAYEAEAGDEVTLTAAPNVEPPEVEPPTAFVGWSDARCPGTGPCTVPVDSDAQTVTALFSPQRVTVKSVGPGTVTTPGGAACEPKVEGRRRFLDCGRFPILSEVPLQANPLGPAVIVTWEPALCQAPQPVKGDLVCAVSVLGPTEGRVGFDDEPGGDLNPTISVSFRVFKQGDGSGTVRSASLDCGRRCAIDGHFGDRETLVADPAPGSAFAGWRGVCSSAPRCSFAVGPVTSAVAVFESSATAKDEPGRGPSHRAPDTRAAPTPRPAGAPFVARLKRVAVTGHGRHRRVLMRLQLNAPATVRAALRRGRHRAAGGRWRMRGGTPLVRLRVPARARPGHYRLAVSIRDAAGHATRVSRRVWLPR
jgi:Divergent InlB B-repeat domain